MPTTDAAPAATPGTYQPEAASGGVHLRPAWDVTDAGETLAGLHAAVLACGGQPAPALRLARELGATMPLPGRGQTLRLWEALATMGAADLGVARMVEPHLDALAILAQAEAGRLSTEADTWGVFAARAPGIQLTAARSGRGWRLTGTKPWCSLGQTLNRALVTAEADDGTRLFAVDLHHDGVSAVERAWTALGLPSVPSQGLSFLHVPATAVGGPGWYVQRPGFSWGGVGVAAIWHGAATTLARRLYEHCGARTPDQIAQWQVGRADQALWAGRTALYCAAEEADRPNGTGAPLTAARVRTAVVCAAEEVLALAAHGMGPEPLAFEPAHAQRVADLELYLRQDHAERAVAAHGGRLLATGRSPW
ncbi:acyl-CoA dehydrogenase [Specibacter sp. RAF43]|uniref:acyl-CoA dehydrogenase n=1 Tax=Specibacter sp. RAF43 TaxID=3233057 RepID=UPI003F974E30